VILTASILIVYVTWQVTKVKLPDDDIEMSKHVGIYIIKRDIVVIYTVVILTVQLLVVIKNRKYLWHSTELFVMFNYYLLVSLRKLFHNLCVLAFSLGP
jgi:hypothetical protein